MPGENHILILGAGVCGLHAGITALKHGAAATIIEKESRPGGLATGQQHGANFYDLGVHMLHAFDREIFESCAAAMGDERIETPLHAHIKWAGKLYHYPLRGRDILRGIPPVTLARCITGLFTAEFRSRFFSPPPPQNAEDALIQLYGNPLYRFFFEEFTHRYWDTHPRELSAEFVRSKMPRLSAVDVLKNALEKLHLAKPRDGAEGALRFETLHYSRTGAETLPRSLAAEFQRLGGTLHLDTSLEHLHLEDGRASSATVRHGDRPGTIDCDACLSTIPLPVLANALRPRTSSELQEHAAGLRFKPIAVYGLLVRKNKCMDASYTYYRDRIFHRVGEPKNAGLTVHPADHTVLIVETTCETGDPKWAGEILPDILDDLRAEGLCDPSDVVEHHLMIHPHGYPVFELGFEEHLTAIRDHLDTIPNLRSTGRQGAFTYPNMHGAMRMGHDNVLNLLQTDS